MRMGVWFLIGMAAVCGGLAHSADLTPEVLFEKPVPLADGEGKPLITKFAQGCPAVGDFNGDGKYDIILGAHEGMDTAIGGIWLIPNAGANEKPAFDMAQAYRVQTGGSEAKVSCGCKSSGRVLVQAADWNGDGFMDIVYSDTYVRAYLLINDGKSKDKPAFTKQVFHEMEKTNHGMLAGGGDWDGDGVADWLHMPFAGAEYRLFKGDDLGGKGLKFAEGGLKSSVALKIDGDKATNCAWAWDFSGTSKVRGVTEYAGIQGNTREIGLFEVANGKSRKVCVLATAEGANPQVTLGDLNGDGKMDLLFSSGLWNNEADKTKVCVMYGKVANTKASTPAAGK